MRIEPALVRRKWCGARVVIALLAAAAASCGSRTEGLQTAAAQAPVTPRSAARSSDRFVDVTAEAGIGFVHVLVDGHMSNIGESPGSGAAFRDYGGDGWLDLYLVQGGWAEEMVEGEAPDDAPSSRLFRNRGGGTFEDVTGRAGVAATGLGIAAVAADYDGDGRSRRARWDTTTSSSRCLSAIVFGPRPRKGCPSARAQRISSTRAAPLPRT